MDVSKTIQMIGYASGVAANNPGCALGPIMLQSSACLNQLPLKLSWQDILYAHPKNTVSISAEDKLGIVEDLCKRLAEQTHRCVQNKQKFVTIGGDHTCAIGTWSGAYSALAQQDSLGLLWVDAHMDSHTPATSLSGNIHGMPLATLLGHGNPRLTQIMDATPKLKAENVCLVGVRSYETGEAELLKKLGVKIFFMTEVISKGLQVVMQEALELVKKNTAAYGISIDLDAFDPIEVPGVGVPEPHGIKVQNFCGVLSDLKLNQDNHLLGVEIVEFNPHLDQDHKTETAVANIFKALFLNDNQG